MKKMWKAFSVLILVAVFLFGISVVFFAPAKDSIRKPVIQSRRLVADIRENQVSHDVEMEMRQRVKNLERECKKLTANGSEFLFVEKSKLDHIVVDDRYKVMYCYVPKVACTNLKRVFLMLTGQMNVTDPLLLKSADVHSSLDHYLSYLDSFPAAGIKYRFHHYKKVIFVREPLERLLSAFRNKFLQRGNSYFKLHFGKTIIKRYRDNPSNESLNKGEDVTFTEFVQYLLDPKTIEKGYNEHWQSFYDLCHPCNIQYNYIGKYETLDRDVDELLKILKVHDKIHFPERTDMYKTSKTEDMLLNFFRILDPDTLRKIIDVYEKDYKVFGFNLPDGIDSLLNDL
ncbi:hypothetical protein ACF0H5_014855 [Mactra antiquata]